MSDVEKRAILVASNLNIFVLRLIADLSKFFNNEKRTKKKQTNSQIISSNISKSSIKESKRNSMNFWIRPSFYLYENFRSYENSIFIQLIFLL